MRHRRPCGYEVVALLAAAFLMLFPSVLLSQVSTVPTISRMAGTGSSLFNGDQGLSSTISLNAPTFVIFDKAGNQYVSDSGNNCVRRIDLTGNITTVAGLTTTNASDTCDTSSNLNPTPAQGLAHPTGLAIDPTGRLYIADSLHHCVRSLAPSATGTAALTTVAGTCGSASSASITPNPQGLALDFSGNLYVVVQNPTSDPAGTTPIYQVLRHAASASFSDACVIAGPRSPGLTLCPNISGTARLDHPSGLTIDATNNLYIADTGNQCVRRITNLTMLETAVGQCASDGTGTSLSTLRNPFGLAFTPTGTLLITQSSPDTMVSFSQGSTPLTLVAGLPNGTAGAYLPTQDSSPATTVPLNAPRGIAVDRLGNIFLADSANNILRRIAITTPLTVKIASVTRTYGSPNPDLAGTVSGVLPSEKIGETLTITYSTVATTRSAAGRYAITATVTGPSAANYDITVQPGTLEITPTATSTIITTSTSSVVSGSSITLTATVSSLGGVPAGIVAFYDGGVTLLGTSNLNSSGVATFSTSTLATGSHTIAAIFRDTTNYTTSAATLTQTVAAPTGSFTLTASQPMPATRSNGQSVYQLTLNSIGIFSGTVALSCSGLPAGGNCAFSASPTLAPGGSTSVVMTVTIPSVQATLIAPAKNLPSNLTPLAAAIFPFELPFFGIAFSRLRLQKRRRRAVVVIAAFTLMLFTLTGCGAGGSVTSPTSAPQTANYTIQVTGTSLNFAAQPQTITLTVSAQ